MLSINAFKPINSASHNASHLQDIKPANLLIDQEDQLKVADFGLSRLYDSDYDKSYSPQVIHHI